MSKRSSVRKKLSEAQRLLAKARRQTKAAAIVIADAAAQMLKSVKK